MTRLVLGFAVLLLLTAGILAFARLNQTPGQSSPLDITFAPVADTYISQSNPDSNYGGGPTLRIDQSPLMRAYLRFEVQGLSGVPTRATLRLHANSDSVAGLSVAAVADNSWGENSLTFNHAPAVGNVIQTSAGLSAGSWVSVDVSRYVTGNGSWSFALSAPGNTQVNLSSRESTADTPQLIISTSSSVAPALSVTPTVVMDNATPAPTATLALAGSPTVASATPTPTLTPAAEASAPPLATETPAATRAAPTSPPAPTGVPATSTPPPAPSPAGASVATIVPPSNAAVPAFDHIFLVVEENHAYSQIIGSAEAPYINSLANQYGLATQYTAIRHPSLPNYLSLVGGGTFGVTTDCLPITCTVSAPNIADRLEASGKSWKAYLESMPAPCRTTDSGNYVVKHNPFVYFDDIRTNATRCTAHDVPYTELGSDLARASTTPNFVWISPNLCNDMHNCSVSTGDTWLKSQLPAIFNSPAWTTQNSVLFLVWDEDDDNSANAVTMVVVGAHVKPGYRSAAAYTHYSLLRTVEAAWQLPALGSADANIPAMTDFWK